MDLIRKQANDLLKTIFLASGPWVGLVFLVMGTFTLHPGLGMILVGVLVCFLWMCEEADRTVEATKSATDEYFKTSE